MPDDFHDYEDEAFFNPETHHEESDVNVRALLVSAVVFIVFALITHFLIYALLQEYRRHERQSSAALIPMTMMAHPASTMRADEPRLQPYRSKDIHGTEVVPYADTPVTDMLAMRASEETVLTSYGWVDRQKGTVRMPIEEAKRIALQRGFAVTAAAPAPAILNAAPVTPAQQKDASGGQQTSGGAQQ